ncbi:MAG: hypothetical protein KDD38_06820, partial [Bdellovibrionales bacterium]|nr:hypothetical protein [Bdellovibrionales bacterium]
MFKLLGLFCALFVGASASASAPSLSILRQGVTYNCDPQTPPETSEDWSCSTEETDRNAELLEYG